MANMLNEAERAVVKAIRERLEARKAWRAAYAAAYESESGAARTDGEKRALFETIYAYYLRRLGRLMARGLLPRYPSLAAPGKKPLLSEGQNDTISMDIKDANGKEHSEENGQFVSIAMKQAAKTNKGKEKEPYRYIDLAPDRMMFPAKWQPTEFESSAHGKDHFSRHGKGLDATDSDDYVSQAKAYLTSPRGKYGDAFVSKDGRIGRYDYRTHVLSLANSKGKIHTYWKLTDTKSPEAADDYWEALKNDNLNK
jgi:hypothetical protein